MISEWSSELSHDAVEKEIFELALIGKFALIERCCHAEIAKVDPGWNLTKVHRSVSR